MVVRVDPMARETVPPVAEWPELRVRIEPRLHRALKAKIHQPEPGGYRYYNSLSDVVNRELRHLLKGPDSVESRDP